MHHPLDAGRVSLFRRHGLAGWLLLLVLGLPLGCARRSAVEDPNPTPIPSTVESLTALYPGEEWSRIDSPESVGYSDEALASLHEYVEGLNTTAVMAVVNGRVLFEHGDLDSLSYLASVRKSILAMLYGNYVEDGTIDLEASLEDLGMDDEQGLMPIERQATVRDLITARSGIYHPASNAGDNSADAPPRGSQEPGTYYLYNNWDFNAAGAAFELMTGRDIYDALQTDLAGADRDAGLRPRQAAQIGRSTALAEHGLPHVALDTRHGADRLPHAPRRRVARPCR